MKLTKKQTIKPYLIALSLACGPTVTQAAMHTYSLDYSGFDFGNTAVAHAILTIDDLLLANPSGPSFLNLGQGQAITALTLTVSNASAGNGTFQLSDFDYASWDTAGETLDFSAELIGQWTSGFSGWGRRDPFDSSMGAGDFNLYANASSFAPTGSGYFTLAANNDFINGDLMRLTSFKPAPVPLPAAAWLFGGVMGGFLSWQRKRCA